MALEWTAERLSTLSDNELRNLAFNAKNRDRTDLVNLCEVALLSRKPKRAPPPGMPEGFIRVTRSVLAKKIEIDTVDLLVQLSNRLISRFDLSAAKAQTLSEGTKRFIPHRLTDAKGMAKVGGAQKSGLVVFDRYISYRLKDEIYALIALLFEGDNVNDVVYQVIGPKSILTNALPISEQRPYLRQNESIGLAKYAENFRNFDEAAERFLFLMEQVAPKR